MIPEGALEKVSERTVAEISTGTRDEVVVNVRPGVDVVEQVPTGVVLKEETYIVNKPLKKALPNGNKA